MNRSFLAERPFAVGIIVSSIVLIIAIGIEPLAAGTLYGVDGNRKTLVAIDSETGVATEIGVPGTLGFGPVTGASFHPTTEILFGVDVATDRLITIDTATGIGSAAGTGPTGVGTPGQGEIGSAAFAPDGTFYAYDPFPASLVTIDLTTGAATRVVPNPPASFIQVDGMSFSPNGTLFGAVSGSRSLVTINPTTGALTTVGTIHVGGTSNFSITGLAFAPDGTLFGVTPGLNSTLLTIDPVTAEATVIADTGLAILCLAYGPETTEVPAPSTLALTGPIFGLLLVRRWRASR